MKTIKLIASSFLAIALTHSVHAQQASQYLASTATNAQVTAIQNQIVKTNMAVYSSFSTAAAHRYTQVTFQNLSTNKIVFASTLSGAFTNSSTNAVGAAGGVVLAPAGTVGDSRTYNLTVPRNGPANGGSATWVFQVGTGGDLGVTGLVNVEALGF